MMRKVIPVIIGFLFISPLILITTLTYTEIKSYEPLPEYNITAKAYGEIDSVFRGDIEEIVEISGKFISEDYIYYDFVYGDSDFIKIHSKEGSEVKKEDILIEVGDKKYTSTYNGIVEEIIYTSGKGYVKILNIENIVFEVLIPASLINLFNVDKLETETKESIKSIYTSEIIASGKIRTIFEIISSEDYRKYYYGQISTFRVYTGRTLENVLLVDKNSIYQKQLNGPYFVREVTSEGDFIYEREVLTGIQNLNSITVVGIEEGAYVDKGYAEFINTQIEPVTINE